MMLMCLFEREGGGGGGGVLFQILNLRRNANLKPVAYLKVDANSSIHSMCIAMF